VTANPFARVSFGRFQERAETLARELTYILGQSDTKALLLTDHLGGIDYFETLHETLPGLPDSVPGELAFEKFPAIKEAAP
jgi:hypothetical protein